MNGQHAILSTEHTTNITRLEEKRISSFYFLDVMFDFCSFVINICEIMEFLQLKQVCKLSFHQWL